MHSANVGQTRARLYGKRKTSQTSQTSRFYLYTCTADFLPFIFLGISAVYETTLYLSKRERNCVCVYDLISRRSYVTLENCSLKIVRSNKRAMEKLCRQLSEKRTASYIFTSSNGARRKRWRFNRATSGLSMAFDSNPETDILNVEREFWENDIYSTEETRNAKYFSKWEDRDPSRNLQRFNRELIILD